MTREEILNMEAGREMDALVAKMVTHNNYVFNNEHPSYSTNIASAWEVVEKLGYNWTLTRDVGKCGNDYETAGDMTYRFIYAAPGLPMEGVTADPAPLAICRAALLAVLEDSS